MKFYPITLFVVFCLACKKGTLNPNKNPAVIEKSVYFDSAIVGLTENSGLSGFYEIGAGDKTVFDFQYRHAEDLRIADDELAEFFVFQLDPQIENATFMDEQLYQLNPVYRFSCYCLNDQGLSKMTGKLSIVKKGNSKWQVDADLTFILKIEEYNEAGGAKPLLSTYERKLNFSQLFKK